MPACAAQGVPHAQAAAGTRGLGWVGSADSLGQCRPTLKCGFISHLRIPFPFSCPQVPEVSAGGITGGFSSGSGSVGEGTDGDPLRARLGVGVPIPSCHRLAPACSARAAPLKVPTPGQPAAHDWEAGDISPDHLSLEKQLSEAWDPRIRPQEALQRLHLHPVALPPGFFPHTLSWEPPPHQEHLDHLGSASGN